MEYGVIGTSEPDTKDGLEELCPVCGDKVRTTAIAKIANCKSVLQTLTVCVPGVRLPLRPPHLRVLQRILQADGAEQEGVHLRGGQELCHRQGAAN